MSKVKPQSGRAHGPGNSRDKPSKTAALPSSGSFDSLRSEIQARFQIADSKSPKENKHSKGNSGKPSFKHGNKDDRRKSEPDRGKKRDRNGRVLVQDKRSGEQDTDVQEDDGEDEFTREMKALGGTEEDFELLAEADSDSELEGPANDNAQSSGSSKTKVENLDKGMKNILKEIALAQGVNQKDKDTASMSEEEDPIENDMTARGDKTTLIQDQKVDKSKRGTRVQFLCEPRADWFNLSHPDFDAEQMPLNRLSQDSLNQLQAHARSLLDAENQKFKGSPESSSAQAFYNTVIASGTLSDKISALTLAVQESPLHNMRALETLIGLARKRSRSQAVDVLRALKDLFAQGSLLPESRKLYAFTAQPSLPHLFTKARPWKTGDKLPRGLGESHLVTWAFESWLKEQYFEVLKILEVWCNDEIEYSKGRAVSYVFELLKERPEQESNLLRLLVNKLGDPVKKIASQASYLLMQLLIAHPAMKGVVVSAVETDFIFRPGQSMHGKYYAVVTLNQTALSSQEEEVAVKLLDIYFGLFTGLLKPEIEPAKETEKDDNEPSPRGRRRNRNKKPEEPGQSQTEELREKLISAILTGVNRAYPYAGTDGTSFSDHLETLFKITHSSNFNTGIQAMLLIQQLSHSHRASNDRFYRVLYESMLDPRLIIASKQQMYLNLLHRALKADLNVKRVKAFVKRLIQILSLHEPSFICGAFFLIQDLEKTFPSIAGLVDQPEDHDDDEEVFRDVDEDATEDAPNETLTPGGGSVYDGHKRAPEHANADNSCAWELLPFLAHFHPSVSVSADHVLRHTKLPGKPDLGLHTLSHFLDRFVYRNPKLATTGLRGSSLMQPMAASDTQSVLISSSGAGVGGFGVDAKNRQTPVNSEAFRLKKTEDVAAEDVFFHQYFSSLGKAKKDDKKKTQKTKKGRRDEDDEDDEEADEDEVWKAMMSSAPDLEGEDFDEDDEDLDLDMSDMSDVDGDGVGGGGDDDDEEVDFDPAFFDDDDEEEGDDKAAPARKASRRDRDLMDVDLDLDDHEDEIDSEADEEDEDDEDDDDDDAAGPSDFAGFGSDADEGAASTTTKKKGAKSDAGKGKDKDRKKRLKSLPTFASVADYAKMLDDEDDEDV